MEPDPQFWAGKRVCVTGGTGFLGWHLIKQLLPLTSRVRFFGLRPASRHLSAQLQNVDGVYGDVRDPDAVRQAVHDCQIVFHTAGTVAVWGPMLKQLREIHVVGTQQVLQALPSGARLVHTSSVVAIGAARGDEVLTEVSPFNLQSLRVDYVHAKRAAEEVALQSAGRGVDAVVVNPGYLIGPEDYDRSVMGRLCLRGWKGKMRLVPPGLLNFVDVRDVARGHLLAAEKGRSGSRYILGGENLSMWDLVRSLVNIRGTPTRRHFPMPAFIQTMIAWYAECQSLFVNREPYPSRQFARMCRYRWHYSSARAEAELGYRPRSMHASLLDTYHWFRDNGFLKRPRVTLPGSLPDNSQQRAA